MKFKLLSILGIICLQFNTLSGQTVISGPNISGNWSTAGSPYIIVSDCTVPAGEALTIQPGTVVWLGHDVSLTVRGLIQALGTPLQRISFQAPISSQSWKTIEVTGTAGTNEFKYCDIQNSSGEGLSFNSGGTNELYYCNFQDSTVGVALYGKGSCTLLDCNFNNLTNGLILSSQGATVKASVIKCVFSNCIAHAILGEGQAFRWEDQPSIDLESRNCLFLNSEYGCHIKVGSHGFRALAHAKFIGNVFFGIAGTAVNFEVGNYTYPGKISFINNTVVHCGTGLVVADPLDATIQSCIFNNCSNAVIRSGSLSTMLGFNNFFNNSTNIVGYPLNYGQPIIVNRNGTPSDLLFNIFQDPLFVTAADFHLQPGSPCVDAGESSAANYDSYFPPSLGSVTNDMGAYGGPSAGQWIAPFPTNVFSLGVVHVPYVSITINPLEPGHYRLEYDNSVGGGGNWMQLTNLQLNTAPFTYLEPATSPARIYRAIKQ